jgi:hypothetical protein
MFDTCLRRPFSFRLLRRLAAAAGMATCVAAAADDVLPVMFQRSAPLRDLNTDRPDVTEGPFTVDAGHLQVEMDFVSITHNRVNGDRTRSSALAPFNLRLGLLQNLEVGIFVAPYTRQVDEPRGGMRETRRGFGDIGLRAKVNLWGNDGGASAFGLIADLTLPTGAEGIGDDHLSGGVIFPAAFELGEGWELGAMTEFDLRPGTSTGTQLRWINSATLGHALAGDLSGYVELTSDAGEGAHVATFDVGLTLKLDTNTQVDLGANFGVSRAADDLQVFTGLTRRF